MLMVSVDGNNLVGDSDFPDLDLSKYGWEQFPELSSEDAIMRCWRAEVIISARHPIDKSLIDKSMMLKLIIAAGDSTDHIDLATAKERGIKVCHVPGLDPANASTNQSLCRQVVDIVNSFYKNELINEV